MNKRNQSIKRRSRRIAELSSRESCGCRVGACTICGSRCKQCMCACVHVCMCACDGIDPFVTRCECQQCVISKIENDIKELCIGSNGSTINCMIIMDFK